MEIGYIGEMALDPRSLIQFVTVAQELSFSRAAERLAIAQPWLSRRILQLEADLGFRLFDRTTRRIALTEKGAAFLEAARPAAEALRQAEQTARALARSARATLRVGVPPYGGRIAARNAMLARLARTRPDITLELEVGWTPLLLERLRARALDAAFGLAAEDTPDLIRQPLETLGVQLRLGPADPWIGREAATLAELQGRRIAVFTRGLYPALYDQTMAPLAQAGAMLIDVPEVRDELIARDDGTPPLMLAAYAPPGDRRRPGRLPLVDGPTVAFCLFVASGEAAAVWRGAEGADRAR